MKKNRIRICGRNTTTAPTPAITPVGQQVAQRSRRAARLSTQLAEPVEPGGDRVHRRLRPGEHRLEHHEQQRRAAAAARRPDAARPRRARWLQRRAAVSATVAATRDRARAALQRDDVRVHAPRPGARCAHARRRRPAPPSAALQLVDARACAPRRSGSPARPVRARAAARRRSSARRARPGRSC